LLQGKAIACRPATAPYQGDRIDIEKEGGCADIVAGVWVEDRRVAEAELKRLHLRRMFMEQPTEVGGWGASCGDGQ
jgi:hypothetical protein